MLWQPRWSRANVLRTLHFWNRLMPHNGAVVGIIHDRITCHRGPNKNCVKQNDTIKNINKTFIITIKTHLRATVANPSWESSAAAGGAGWFERHQFHRQRPCYCRVPVDPLYIHPWNITNKMNKRLKYCRHFLEKGKSNSPLPVWMDLTAV